MKFRIIEDQRETFPIRVLCDVMGVSAAGDYAWRGRPESPRKTANRALLAEIRSLHLAHRGRYGAPRIHVALRDLGHTASRGRIERLMRHHGIIKGNNSATVPDMHYGQPSRLAHRSQPAQSELCCRSAQSGLACRHNLCANLGRLALSGCRARSFHKEDCWMGDA